MAHRAVAAVLALGGLLLLPIRPLVAGILFACALTVVMDRRGLLGHGRYRATHAFIAGPLLGLVGVGVSLLGLPPHDPCAADPCQGIRGNFLLLPGLLLLAIGVGLVAWALFELVRRRRAGGA
jgi:hypothetical protein